MTDLRMSWNPSCWDPRITRAKSSGSVKSDCRGFLGERQQVSVTNGILKFYFDVRWVEDGQELVEVSARDCEGNRFHGVI
jgi:hypothetical protein